MSEALIETNLLGVKMIRQRIQLWKLLPRAASPVVRVREGLVLPVIWINCYQAIYHSNLP